MCVGFINLLFIVGCIAAAIGLAITPYYALVSINEEYDQDYIYTKNSISRAIGLTPEEELVDCLLIISLIILIIIGYGREIQLRVIFARAGLYKGIVVIVNVLNVIIIAISAGAFLGAIVINVNSNNELHTTLGAIGWSCLLTYHLLHMILTLYERFKCSIAMNFKYVELIYLVCAYIVATIFSIIFISYQTAKGDISGFDDKWFGYEHRYFYEWVAWWLIATFYLVMAVLFARNSVHDELEEFCCGGCGCCPSESKAESNYNRNQLEMV